MRREIKRAALLRLKKIYWLAVVICLLLGLFGISYSSTITAVRSMISGPESRGFAQWRRVAHDLIKGDPEKGDARTDAYIRERQEKSERYGVVVIEHADGVIAQLTNTIFSGKILISIYSAIRSVVHAENVTLFIMIILAFALAVFLCIFLNNLFKVTARRMMLEARLYDEIPKKRFLFFIRNKNWMNIVKVLLLRDIKLFLWSLTIVGGVIKNYSYALVPYIVAENPKICAKEAVLLSKRMMQGHKWELFVFKLSFFGWELLSTLTQGIVGIFFVNPYTELAMAEYYVHIRTLAKEESLEGVAALNDPYLFTYAEDELLREVYKDALPFVEEAPEELPKNTGVRGFLENVFGITPVYDEKEAAYEQAAVHRAATEEYKSILEKKSYPVRLFTDRRLDHLRMSRALHYDRHYSLTVLVMMFFTACMIGWGWEVLFHLVEDGKFINRGILHGPWLPIYGTGGCLILIVLNRFRHHPVLEFGLTVVLCGVVEYFTAYYMEWKSGGIKWWDYTGYYLNINGRVCAEGLLVFGIGGIAFIYIFAPLLDNILRTIPKRMAFTASVVLLLAFSVDLVYSFQYPNIGEGITYFGQPEQQAADKQPVSAQGDGMS